MTDIADFIEARVAEDEAYARAAVRQEFADQHDPNHLCWHASGSPGDMGVAAGGELEDLWGDGPEWIGDHTVVYAEGYPDDDQAQHIARHDPARVLRQVAAIRVALGYYRDDDWVVMEPTIKAIAAIWADHPNYRQEWRL